MAKNHTIAHMCGPQDANGNPRRIYVVNDVDTKKTTYYDEGYFGRSAVPYEMRKDSMDAGEMKITAGEYRHLRSMAKSS